MIEIQEAEVQGYNVLRLKGELLRENAGAFRARVMERATGKSARIVLEMWDVEFVDSVGLAALIGLSEDLRKQGRYLVLYRPSPNIKKVLKSIHAGSTLSIVASLSQM